jgi:uncharacterized lipoprotein YddW (UPF0748 family)
MSRLSAFFSFGAGILLCAGCTPSSLRTLPADRFPGIPPADREFRAVWVATVVNIDWPSAPGLTSEQQQQEMRTILDSVAAIGMNAVILQVRPQCDAIYPSRLEPWSAYLTGTQGKAPDPLYDPLAAWVAGAHARGIELHVWFNPYRAHLANAGEPSDSSIVRRKPHLVRRLPDGMYWMDPSMQETQDHSLAVVLDVVSRYDIDGVHFDDYFYPYGDGNFPDSVSWVAYRNAGGTLTREDWRRSSVNTFIRRVYEGIKREKPHVKFGISPFGIWRPGFPRSIGGFDQFAVLYADARLWLNEGWLDYWTPQLYWPINQIPQSFPVLLGWWTKENTHGRNLWPGLFTSRMTGVAGADEVLNQVMVTRGFVPDAPGHVHFSMRAFQRDSAVVNDALRRGPYARAALVPPSPWLGSTPPAPPAMSIVPDSDSVKVSWTRPGSVFRWVVYTKYANGWDYRIRNTGDPGEITLPRRRIPLAAARRDSTQPPLPPEMLNAVAVSAVDRLGNESAPALMPVAPPAIP